MIESVFSTENKKSADAVVLSIPYDYSSSFRRGSDKGPKKIIGCLNGKIEFYDRFLSIDTSKEFSIAHDDSLSSIGSKQPKEMVESVQKQWSKHFSRGIFVVSLGGEHAVSLGIFRGLADCVRNVDEITLVQIDAHLDMYDDDFSFNDTNPGGIFSHACVMRRGVELGFRTVQIGIRTYAKEELDYAEKSRSLVFEWGRGRDYAIEDIVRAIKTKKVYLTLDIDGLDPSVAPATGTPVPGGLSWEYCVRFLHHLFSAKEVVSADIVETAPFEDDVRTEYIAAQLCYSMIGLALSKKKRDVCL